MAGADMDADGDGLKIGALMVETVDEVTVRGAAGRRLACLGS